MPDETIHPVYLVKGKEPALRAQAVAGLVKRLTDEAFRDFDLHRLDARTATEGEVLAAATGVPFGSPRKVTLVEDAQRLNADLVEKLQRTLPGKMGEHAVLVFITSEMGDGEKTQGVARRLDSLAKKMGQVIACDPLKAAQAAAWVAESARSRGLEMDAGAREELLARVGAHIGVLEREMEKLGAYAGGRPIRREDVAETVSESVEYSVFILVDAVSEGKAALAVHTLQGLRARNEPVYRITSLLARQLRLVWQAKLLMEDGANAALLAAEPDILKLAPFAQEKARRQARGFTWERLREGFRLLLEMDLALKGVEGPPLTDDEALEMLVCALCRR